MPLPLQHKPTSAVRRSPRRGWRWPALGAAGLVLGVLAVSLPGPRTALAISAQFAVQLTIQGGAMMDIDPVTEPGVMQQMMEDFGDALPAELATHPSFVALLTFGRHQGLPPRVTFMQSELTASAAGVPPLAARTFAVPQIHNGVAQAMVGAYLQGNEAPPGTYHASATVQVLFE
ncbi:MAG: hypothetical protein HY342_06975 [Candidatus Lambdaproteobacteria bacterium]|nr:hypothetical protein [Candidatus Lambdaproteobacteria bacterium]